MTLADWATVALAVIALAQGLVVVAQWRLRAEYASRHVVDSHEKHITDISARLSSVERTLKDEPGREELSRRIERLHGDNQKLGADIKGTRDLLEAETSGLRELIRGIGHQLDDLRKLAMFGKHPS